MPKRKKAPELTFQQHIADYLVREHKYAVLEQSDITDTEHFIAEDQLWAFLKATQADTLKKLVDDYGTDAREEVFKALRKELEHTPLWMLFRQGLPVRGLKFQLYYPKPRSPTSKPPPTTPSPTAKSNAGTSRSKPTASAPAPRSTSIRPAASSPASSSTTTPFDSIPPSVTSPLRTNFSATTRPSLPPATKNSPRPGCNAKSNDKTNPSTP